MATLYVSSVDGNDGTPASVSWWNGNQDTYATVTAALAAATGTGPHLIYISHVSSTTANATITWNAATDGASVAIISVDRASGAWTAGATVAVGASSNPFTIASTAINQTLYLYGLTLVGGTNNNGSCDVVLNGTTSSVAVDVTLHSCTINIPAAHATAQFHIGIGTTSAPCVIRLINCTHNTKDSATGWAISVRGVVTDIFISGLTVGYSGSNKPATLLGFEALRYAKVEIVDSDLTGFNAVGSTYFDVTGLTAGSASVVNCKLHAAPSGSLKTGTFPTKMGSVMLINCGASDTVGHYEYHNALGSIVRSTSVYKDGAASHFGTPVGWNITTTAAASEHAPFVTPWLVWHSDLTDEIDANLEIAFDSATDKTNLNYWTEHEYVSDASFPKGTLVSTRHATPFIGATGADWANVSNAWTGTSGFSNENQQAIGATFTPSEKSIHRTRLFVAAASQDFYLSPKYELTPTA